MDNLISKIKELNSIRPSQSWKEKSKRILMSQIGAQVSVKEEPVRDGLFDWHAVADYILPTKLFVFARPIMASFMMAAVLLSGGAGVVKASWDSIPGDMLYTVKLATEKTRIAFSFDDGKRTSMRLEFISRRVGELDQLAKYNRPDRTARVGVLMSNIKSDIKDVKNRLDEMAKKPESKKTVEIAKAVSDKTDEYQRSISETKKTLSAESGKDVEDVLYTIAAVGDNALDVIIKEQEKDGASITKEEIAARVQKRVELAKEKLDEMAKPAEPEEEPVKLAGEAEKNEESPKTEPAASAEPKKEEPVADSQKAALKLDEAKVFLEKGDVITAFERVKESTQLAEAAKDAVLEEGEKVALPTAADPEKPAIDDYLRIDTQKTE